MDSFRRALTSLASAGRLCGSGARGVKARSCYRHAERLAARQDTATIGRAIGSDTKGKLSLLIYLASIPLAFISTLISCACFVTVAVIWLVPDRRIERAMREPGGGTHGGEH